MQLQEMHPYDLIDPSWVPSYEREITAMWWQLVQLDSNLFILDKLSAFPFDLFQPVPEPFWKVVYDSLFETSIMIVWRVGLDADRRTLTLPQLTDKIRQNLREEYSSEFEDLLRDVDFEAALSDLAPRVRELRHNRIAHFNRDWNVDLGPEQAKQRGLQLSELMALRDELKSLFGLLCFEDRKSVHLIHYHPEVRHPPGVDTRPDIERLLDCVAKQSELLNMPERQPEAWPHSRKNLSSAELEVLNKYRVKLGLPEA